jgi:hypothetical protein
MNQFNSKRFFKVMITSVLFALITISSMAISFGKAQTTVSTTFNYVPQVGDNYVYYNTSGRIVRHDGTLISQKVTLDYIKMNITKMASVDATHFNITAEHYGNSTASPTYSTWVDWALLTTKKVTVNNTASGLFQVPTILPLDIHVNQIVTTSFVQDMGINTLGRINNYHNSTGDTYYITIISNQTTALSSKHHATVQTKLVYDVRNDYSTGVHCYNCTDILNVTYSINSVHMMDSFTHSLITNTTGYNEATPQSKSTETVIEEAAKILVYSTVLGTPEYDLPGDIVDGYSLWVLIGVAMISTYLILRKKKIITN